MVFVYMCLMINFSSSSFHNRAYFIFILAISASSDPVFPKALPDSLETLTAIARTKITNDCVYMLNEDIYSLLNLKRLRKLQVPAIGLSYDEFTRMLDALPRLRRLAVTDVQNTLDENVRELLAARGVQFRFVL